MRKRGKESGKSEVSNEWVNRKGVILKRRWKMRETETARPAVGDAKRLRLDHWWSTGEVRRYEGMHDSAQT